MVLNQAVIIILHFSMSRWLTQPILYTVVRQLDWNCLINPYIVVVSVSCRRSNPRKLKPENLNNLYITIGWRRIGPRRGSGLHIHGPRCLIIFFMTSSSSMKAKILIRPLHLGHVKGSTSYIFWINLAPFFRYCLDDPSDSKIESISSP
jgi:hypothetical protein